MIKINFQYNCIFEVIYERKLDYVYYILFYFSNK